MPPRTSLPVSSEPPAPVLSAEAILRGFLRRLDQHIETARGERDLAPGLFVDRHALFEALGAVGALRVARDEYRLARALGRRGGDIARHRGDLVEHPGAVDEPARVDRNRQHAVRDALGVLPLRAHRAAARYRPGEHLANKGERVTLVLAEGHQRAARSFVHDV